MKKDEKFSKVFAIVMSCLSIAVGIVIIVLACLLTNELTAAISIIIAICCFGSGLANIIFGLVKQNDKIFSLGAVAGSSLIAAGVVLCVDRALIGSFIVYFVGALFVTIAAVNLIQAIVQIVKKVNAANIVLSFIIFALALTLGVLALTLNQKTVLNGIYIVVGAALIITGIVALVVIISHNKKNKKPEEVENK